MSRWPRMIAGCVLVGWLGGGCALMNDGAAKKLPSNMVATPPSYYSTAKARYLGNRYKENLDRLAEKIVRNSGTSQLQFANNISSVGGIGFFTHSATKTPDERYLEVVLATPETFETRGDYSVKVQQLFSRYGQDLLSILAGDTEIFQDKELAGYGLNLNWRTVIAESQGNRVGMARAVVYFNKDKVASFLRQNINQNELLGDAVIFAVEDDGPLQLVSYQPSEIKPDFRPAIREDNLASGSSPARPASGSRTEAETAGKNLQKPAVEAIPANKGEPLVQKPAAAATSANSAAVSRSSENASTASEPIPTLRPGKRAATAAEKPAIRQGPRPDQTLRPNPPLEADSVARVPEVVLPAAPLMKDSEVVEEGQDKPGAPSAGISMAQAEPTKSPTHSTQEMRGAEKKPDADETDRVSPDLTGVRSPAGDATDAKPLSTKESLPAEGPTSPKMVAHNSAVGEAIPQTDERMTATTAPAAEAKFRGLATEAIPPEPAPAPVAKTPTAQTATESKISVPRLESAPLPAVKMPAPPVPELSGHGESPEARNHGEKSSPNSVEPALAPPRAPVAQSKQVARKDPNDGMRPVEPGAENKPGEKRTDVQAASKAADPTGGTNIAHDKVERPIAAKKAPERTAIAAPTAQAGNENRDDASVAGKQLALLPKPPEPVIEPALAAPAVPKLLQGFIIQVAFADKQKAQNWAQKMTRRGYAVSLTEAGPEGALRVRLGNFAVRDEAERELQSFKREGMTGIIINLPQAFRPEARSSLP